MSKFSFDAKVLVFSEDCIDIKIEPLLDVSSKEDECASDLKDEVLNYEEPNNIACDFCENMFKTRSNLESHLEERHSEWFSKIYQCPGCDKSFIFLKSLSAHQNSHVNCQQKCPFCSKSFRRPKNLEYHIKSRHPTEEKETYPCSEEKCGKVFKSRRQLHQHQIMHYPGAPQSCPYCPTILKHQGSLRMHIHRKHSSGQNISIPASLISHSEDKPFICKFCSKRFRLSKNLELHIKNRHPTEETETYPCSEENCGKVFKSRRQLHLHQITHYAGAPQSCPHCPIILKHQESLRQHIHRKHSSAVNVCHICGKKLSTPATLKQHIRLHTGKRPYKCEICGKSFAIKPTLKDHMISHSGEKPFVCKVCDKQFTRRTNLNKHIKKEHSNAVGEISYEDCIDIKIEPLLDVSSKGDNSFESVSDLKDKEPNRFACEFCETMFKSRFKLECHLEERHSEWFPKIYQCPGCDKSFIFYHSLSAHQNAHVNCQQKCPFCSKSFRRRKNLEWHIKSRHPTEETETYPCSEENCGKVFKSRRLLHQHQITHYAGAPQSCPHCPSILKHQESLRQHIHRKHSSAVNLCRICGKTLSTPASLKQHIRLHTGKKPYKCEICGKSFPIKPTLKDHLNTHSGEKPFICKVCNKPYGTRTNMNKHIKKKHSEIQIIM